MSSGFESIVSDQDFSVSERLSKWGAHDHLVFNRLLEDIKAEAADTTMADNARPFYRVLQTSSVTSLLRFPIVVWRMIV